MTFESAIFTRTTGVVAVSDLIDDRMYFRSAPQGQQVRPYVVYQRDYTERHGHMLGAGTIQDASYTFTAVADDPEVCESVALAIADAWDSYAGTVSVGAESVEILDSRVDNEFSEDFAPQPGREAGLYVSTIDIVIGFRVTAPTH